MTLTPEFRYYLACHEAGHAVMALALGIAVSRVTIENECGLTITPGRAVTRQQCRERMCVCLAGAAAEHKAGHTMWAVQTGATTDFEHARRYLEKAGERPGNFWRWFDRTRFAIRRLWKHVDCLAKVLILHETLDGDLIRVSSQLPEVKPMKLDPCKDGHIVRLRFGVTEKYLFNVIWGDARPNVPRSTPAEQMTFKFKVRP